VEQSADTSNRPTPRKGESRVLPGERPDPSQVGQEAALPPVAAPPVSDWRAESEYMAPELAKSLLVPDADARLPLRLVPRNGRLVFMIDGHARIVSATHPSLTKYGIFAGNVMGTNHRRTAAQQGDFSPGSPLVLKREPNNQHDVTAVAALAKVHRASLAMSTRARPRGWPSFWSPERWW
jgi:hypothetical protein